MTTDPLWQACNDLDMLAQRCAALAARRRPGYATGEGASIYIGAGRFCEISVYIRSWMDRSPHHDGTPDAGVYPVTDAHHSCAATTGSSSPQLVNLMHACAGLCSRWGVCSVRLDDASGAPHTAWRRTPGTMSRAFRMKESL